MTLVVLVSLSANLIVFYVIVMTKSLHTPTNIFIINLALADLLNSCYSSWNLLIEKFYVEQTHFLNVIASMLAASFSLTIISFDRLIGIIKPFSIRMSKKTAIYIIIFVWIVAAGFASPPLFYRKYVERQWADYLEIFCTEDKNMLHVYWIILLVVLVWLPQVVMTVVYIIITRTFETYEKKIGNDRYNKMIFKSRQKAVKMLYALILVFFICWTPFQGFILYRSFRTNNNNPWHPSVFFTAHYMTLLNCAINPFIYGMANKNFQIAFRAKFSWIYGEESRLQIVPYPKTSTIIKP
uniref:G-protein coupled receptors family 1 profile domain-containing protein n=1 Tax=Strigamia maritima TaxID=126957 RepID=T1IX36_STRMM